MNVHFIAIGGSAMHNLAIALHKKGYRISGSDDEIFDPAKTRLEKLGLLPENLGWFPEKIHGDLDAIILGMHAKADNPELLKAKEIGLRIFSYPEYLYEQSKDKVRVVIGGSHGKTTITAMVLHVLKHAGIDADYMVGAQLEGFDVMVKLSETAQFMVIEGDEYLTSALDRRPKFHVYQPDIALISGIAWDHVNVFPTFDNYLEQFRIFAKLVPENGSLIYCSEDENVMQAVGSARPGVSLLPYKTPDYQINDGVTSIDVSGKRMALKIFGHHNMQNLEGARLICESIGVDKEMFYNAIRTFGGASKRLELVAANQTCSVFKDFAHSPSKLKATIQAVKEQFPERHLIACMELHTYSSLNINFLEEYKHTMDLANTAVIYYSNHALELKRLSLLSIDDVSKAFGKNDLLVFNDIELFEKFLLSQIWNNTNLLMMSSGNFESLDLKQLSESILS
ncbi:MAG: peptidoglycan synthetase [Bacteroidetes bacterium HGW-Bacteroidetes-11]|jgi:UDP-N-acetylmuramate: L-alanyl-gamma-D-glutamyl-meso-diaminopimelate ligase|nr:MAG: peptidoglycan synthetase [Bacteroidetes bacterium HGW-Bacteroidetes-11]